MKIVSVLPLLCLSLTLRLELLRPPDLMQTFEGEVAATKTGNTLELNWMRQTLPQPSWTCERIHVVSDYAISMNCTEAGRLTSMPVLVFSGVAETDLLAIQVSRAALESLIFAGESEDAAVAMSVYKLQWDVRLNNRSSFLLSTELSCEQLATESRLTVALRRDDTRQEISTCLFSEYTEEDFNRIAEIASLCRSDCERYLKVIDSAPSCTGLEQATKYPNTATMETVQLLLCESFLSQADCFCPAECGDVCAHCTVRYLEEYTVVEENGETTCTDSRGRRVDNSKCSSYSLPTWAGILLTIAFCVLYTPLSWYCCICCCVCFCYYRKKRQRELQENRGRHPVAVLIHQAAYEPIHPPASVDTHPNRESQLPAIEYSTSLSNFNEPLCAICLSEFMKGEMVKLTTCGHIFHAQCLDQWLSACSSRPRCPDCSANPYTDLASPRLPNAI